MKLKVVNLGCKPCYKKIKKLLCKFPEIRDQTFIEKDDTVIIKVVCCCPEKIRTKLICKGGDTIKSIEVIPPTPPPTPPSTPPPTPPSTPPPTTPPPPPVYLVVIYPSGCRCDRRYGCRCEIVIEENPTCTIM
ncbi:sulfated surface glycoprotein 185-like isoform X2 [Vitis riparia]|nr:sulfated surface glycoprotein 185-like isoform X2 [Vitis riparia]